MKYQIAVVYSPDGRPSSTAIRMFSTKALAEAAARGELRRMARVADMGAVTVTITQR